MRYEKFDLEMIARNARNYLTSMVDEKMDYLPYWFVQINEVPAYAKHVRVDDSELVASWYEAIVSLRKILGEDELMNKVEAGFKKHLLRSWGPKGLRYHEDYPWSNTNHSTFHEMAYILGALNRWLEEEPDNKEVDMRASGLVKGMRELVLERKIKTFWNGDYPLGEKVYEFPGDVYLRDGGFVPERVTGRGEEAIRNGMMLHSLVVRADKFKDEVALDLAEGMANHLLDLSTYFNWKGEFFGHVHSAVWVASGLARLSRLLDNEFYIKKANEIFTYVKSISSSFGWVPEYAQWFAPSEVFCETCCIKDMIQCAFELIDNGGFDYWDMINKYVRNQLAENQIKSGCFISVDNTMEDQPDATYKDIDKRVVGGWSGGTEPNSISLIRFRSIAGCCVGTAPQALELVWDRIIQEKPEGIYINLPIEKEDDMAKVEIGYPNEGYIKVTANKPGKYLIRTYDWMGDRIGANFNGECVPTVFRDNCVIFNNVKAGDVIMISHNLETKVTKEMIRDTEFTVTWKGADVVDLKPYGNPIRLYQRVEGVPKEYPQSTSLRVSEFEMKPTAKKK